METTLTDAGTIQREMAQLRKTLHHDVRGVVAGAEAATDWRKYVGLYPWACLAAAFCGGFALAPGRRRHSIDETLDEAAGAAVEQAQVAVAGQIQSEKATASHRPALFGAALAFFAPMAVRAAQNLAAQYVDKFLDQRSVNSPAGSSESAAGSSELSGRNR